jgi:hypothetical protein
VEFNKVSNYFTKKNGHVKIFIILLLSSSCVQTQNSSSGDQGLYEKTVIDTSTPTGHRFSDAFTVIKTNCVGCHASMNLTTEELWLDSGYISAGAPASSILYCRIQGSACGTQDMPKDGTISNDDLNKVKVWIENL